MIIKIGTRASRLAIIQANLVKSSLLKIYPNLNVELVKITTTGDKFKDKPLTKIGGKALFVKELEEALLSKKIDIAVHSLKDIPATIAPGLTIAGFLKGEDSRDAVISLQKSNLLDLPHGTIIGTSSPRRAVQLLRIRSDFKIVPLRGNVDSRIKKVQSQEIDATLLAVAGLKRLGISDYTTIDYDQMIPAVGQGVICAECCENNIEIVQMLSTITDKKTKNLMLAERGFIETINGDCSTPLGAHSYYINNKIKIIAFLAKDQNNLVTSSAIGDIDCAYNLGKDLANKLKDHLI